MELAVEKVYSKEILYTAAELFEVNVEEKPLGDFENYLYKAKMSNGQNCVLRITHSSHRNEQEILAELSFLKYVCDNGANAAAPYFSKQGNLVELLPASDGTTFFASLFEWANGSHVKIDDPSIWNDELFYVWGKTIGKLHALTKNYPHTSNRKKWDEEQYVIDLQNDSAYGEYAKRLTHQLNSSEQTNDTYGLIHSDLHHWNFFYDKGVITAFDFDDLQYNYFVHDLAMVLYYSKLSIKGTEEEKNQFYEHQLSVLRKGYETENKLDERWYDSIPLFMQKRDLELYQVLTVKLDGKEMSPSTKSLYDTVKQRIESAML
ncbi:phosphotransferase [Bacillus sp. RG28]|uniref:Phosphotransferase n=1 Tax=Gottfriedia endophytica TaxID=2820819 RepID=A0A940NPR0_9BACI|nr:phosphotransferase [Gottfriedia endophytica]MBP0726059.1 phosphotransferase [Gottfriedia endophytica]